MENAEERAGAARNWAGNIRFDATTLRRPRSIGELQELVASSEQVHALGTGHSFSEVAGTDGVLVSLEEMPQEIEVRPDRAQVRVSAGTRFADLAESLQSSGLALANLGSLPHIAVAGACATGTHGSGDRNGNLSSLVRALEVVGADGELATIGAPRRPDGSDSPESRPSSRDLDGSVIACGSLGIVSALHLAIVESFEVRQTVYEQLDLETALDHLDELLSMAYSVSLFVDWSGPSVSQVWLKERVGPSGVPPPRAIFGAPAADGPRHPLPGFPPDQCTTQLGIPGPWNERLPHFRADQAPSAAGDELQSEYLVGRGEADEAVRRLERLHERLAPLVRVSELRSVAADELWLSPAYRRDSVALHFTWLNDEEAVRAVLPALEAELAPFGARPHWGKLFALTPEAVAKVTPRLSDFAALCARRDPAGKFANDFSRRHLGLARS